jgi:hypothetical protein
VDAIDVWAAWVRGQSVTTNRPRRGRRQPPPTRPAGPATPERRER